MEEKLEKVLFTEREKEYILKKTKEYLQDCAEINLENETVEELKEFINNYKTLTEKEIEDFVYNLYFSFEYFKPDELKDLGFEDIEIEICRKVCLLDD